MENKKGIVKLSDGKEYSVTSNGKVEKIIKLEEVNLKIGDSFKLLKSTATTETEEDKYEYKVIGMDIKYPLLIALAIGFVDALPILGSGTVMVPWAIISALNGDLKLGISILVLWIIMSLVRQVLEPKIVSGRIGIHPIFTLIAMYTGFKVIGVMGMILGPIALIIIKSILTEYKV